MRGLVIGLLLTMAGPAWAQGTATEQTACHRDAVRWCKHSLAGGPFTVLGCLAAHKIDLSPRCRAVLKSHGM